MDSIIDLKGKLLFVATNLSPPYVFMDYEKTNNTWLLNGGFEVNLLKALSKHFNFTYQIINCNSDWGIKLPNKTWTGIIGMITSKEADFGFGGLTVTHQRSEAVFFSDPYIITSVSFITPPPKPKPNITLVLEPFDFLVWVFIIISLILMILNKWLLSKYWIELRKIDINWAIISASLRQSLSCRLPSLTSLRIMMSSWILSCLVLTSSYGGCLYSLMAIPSHVKTIDTIKDLAIAQKVGRIQVTVSGSSSYYHTLKESKFGVYQEIGELIKPVKNKIEGLDIVRNSTRAYAYISARDYLTYAILKYGKTSFHLPPDTQESTIFLDLMAIAMQKQFKYKNEFNKFISYIKNGGFLDYWRLTENRKRIKNNQQSFDQYHEESQGYNRLHFDQLQSAFYLFTNGSITSLLIFLTEIIVRNQVINSFCSKILSRLRISFLSIFYFVNNIL